jgi:cytochrome c-type biogenesis protein CcmI
MHGSIVVQRVGAALRWRRRRPGDNRAMKERRDERAELEARLRQLADYRAKGLIRKDEADAQQAMLQRRLLDAVMPDAPVKRVSHRTRLVAIAGMAAVVMAAASWLLWGDAGLQPRTLAVMRMMAQGRPRAAPGTGAPASTAVSGAASGASAPLLDPHAWISGRVEVAPWLARRVGPDDSVFITLRHPGEEGLPLAAVRKRADDLPIDFSLGPKDALGDPSRVTAASAPVVVEARISASGRGLAQKGDLTSETPPAPLGSTGVQVIVIRVRGD